VFSSTFIGLCSVIQADMKTYTLYTETTNFTEDIYESPGEIGKVVTAGA